MQAGIEQAKSVYRVQHWSGGYVDINEAGDVVVRVRRAASEADVPLPELVEQLKAQGLRLPVLVRFTDILRDRVEKLHQAFHAARERVGYQGDYCAVYPIKVNQQRRVVEEIIHARTGVQQAKVGLEAGSKPELMAVLAMTQPGDTIICNGYKDQAFIDLALSGQKLGRQVFIVLEKTNELAMVMDSARRLGVEPNLGVRVRLASVGKGNWQNTGGDKSKFGLSAQAILGMVAQLREQGALSALKLLHFHLGSQIANIRDIRHGLTECAQFYRQLHAQGVPVSHVDVGGGLGVDYEGTHSRSYCSANYSIGEYANNVVQSFAELCQQHDLPHPALITESGRAMVAHHAVLIADVIDREQPEAGSLTPPPPPRHPATDNLMQLQARLAEAALDTPPSLDTPLLEVFHDAGYCLDELQAQFVHGHLSLDERAFAEQAYLHICRALAPRLSDQHRNEREVKDELQEKLASKLFVNFSVFQSLPDVWGINQIFPIVPLSQLQRPLTQRGLVRDITCDSDGRIDQYVDGNGLEATLPLPENLGKSSLLGFFLVGAYQEILGDMHNLFGDTDSADVVVDSDGRYRIEHLQQGNRVDELLSYVNFNPDALRNTYQAEIADSALSSEEKTQLLARLEQGLTGYTYLGD